MNGSWLAQHTQGEEELTFLFCGQQSSSPGESAGPAVREHYVLHFCLAGRGDYQFQDTHCAIDPGEGFLVLPGEVVSIRADQQEPWRQIWVGFTGTRAAEYLARCGLGEKNRVFCCDTPELLERCVQEMVCYETVGWGHEFLLLGELYRFLGWISRSYKGQNRRKRETGTDYVERATEYIRSHFQEDLTVAKLAHYVGLNRSYLTTVFQNTLHVSPQQFLMRFRMERASQLLLEGTLSIGEIARSCGYPDPLTFSKAFKRTLGMTPSQYQSRQTLSNLVQPPSKDSEPG
ncbi:MAG: AraC family transcriptional regulator [Oscillospiraceae bacterium]|jgi:AraC-like DNA-binding protein|nr:AraC family transcriptional regulator [Oscillospiraceae bacterium]